MRSWDISCPSSPGTRICESESAPILPPLFYLLILVLPLACVSAAGRREILVREVRGGAVLVEIPRDRVERVIHGARTDGTGQDRIFIEGREVPLEGRVLEETRQVLLVEIGGAFPESAPDPRHRLDAVDAQELRESIRKEILGLGSLEGRVLQKGKPLEGCRVRVVAMEEDRALGFLSTWRPGDEYPTVTDNQGVYRFDELPAGAYKVFWWPPWEDGWIRRIKWEPDVVVRAGEVATPQAIESRRRVLR